MAHIFSSEEFDLPEELKDVKVVLELYPDDEIEEQKSFEEDEKQELVESRVKDQQNESLSVDAEKTDLGSDADDFDLLDIFNYETPALVPTLEELAYSDYIHNRQLASKKILEFLHEAETKEELQSILEIMCKLCDDEEFMVRSELMTHIPSIALFCKQHITDLGVVIRQQLVPYTVKLLSDDQIQVRKVGHSSLVVLLENNLIDHAQLSEWICPLIAQLAVVDNNVEDFREEDVSVMCKMIPLVGKEIAIKFFLEPFISLCYDSSLPIRKICASSCGIFSKVIDTEPTESTLLPAFYDLCSDDKWSVRKACADVIVDIATVVSPIKRKDELSLFYLSLLNDDARKVQNAAYLSLGGFIATFANLPETNFEYENEICNKTEKSKPYNLDSSNVIAENSKESDNVEESKSVSKDVHISRNFYQRIFNNENLNFVHKSVTEIKPISVSSSHEMCDIIIPNLALDSNFRTRGYSQDFEKHKNGSFKQRETVVEKSAELPLHYFHNSERVSQYNPLDSKNSAMSDTYTLSELSNQLQSDICCKSGILSKIVLNVDEKDTTVMEINSSSGSSNHLKKCVFSERKFFTSGPLQAKDDDCVHFHVDNENVYNDFQFWKIPFPEIKLNTDFEEGNATQLYVTAKVYNEGCIETSATQRKVQIAPDITSSEFLSTSEPKLPKMQVQTSSSNNVSIDLGTASRFSFSKRQSRIMNCERFRRKSVGAKECITDSSCHQDIVPPEILKKFIDIPQHGDLYEEAEDERALHCAFNFPAVAFTLGRKYWPVLKQLCYLLAHDVKWTVRRTIASSLHELAVILGHDIVVEDLLPIFFSLLKDIDEVRLKVVSHLPELLKHLEPQERRQFLPAFEEFLTVDNDRHWRIRHKVAEQLIPSVEMFSPSDVYVYFLPVASSLIEDKISVVRKTAVVLIAVIIKSLSQDEETAKYPRNLLAQFDAKYRQAHKWLMRQIYVLLCEQLAVKRSLSIDNFVDDIIPNLFSLAWDSVPNVRLAVSRCIAQTLLPLDYLPSIQKTQYQLLLQVMYSLQSDVDKDVRYFAYLSAGSFNVVPQKKLLSPV